MFFRLKLIPTLEHQRKFDSNLLTCCHFLFFLLSIILKLFFVTIGRTIVNVCWVYKICFCRVRENNSKSVKEADSWIIRFGYAIERKARTLNACRFDGCGAHY